MTHSRRGFFSLLGGAAAALTLDPERALWVPGKKLISIPRMIYGKPGIRIVDHYDLTGRMVFSRMDVYFGFFSDEHDLPVRISA